MFADFKMSKFVRFLPYCKIDQQNKKIIWALHFCYSVHGFISGSDVTKKLGLMSGN